ncbi:MAG: hypothetical protein KC496_08135, partial [Anaerolineae bacterium]|nr:hypothetical protein [Anaerolineae bacterium]
LLAAIIGVGIASATWGFFLQAGRLAAAENVITWDAALLLFLLTLFSSTIASYYFRGRSRWLFVGVSLALFGGFYGLVSWNFSTLSFALPNQPPTLPLEITYHQAQQIIPLRTQPVFHFDDTNQVYSIALPMLFVIALGTQMQPLLLGWWERIGKAKAGKERGGWLTTMLIYTLVLTGLASVLALFSLKESVAWALGWSLWSFATFVFALATFRWARWGARGLLLIGALAIVGGFAFDAMHIWNAIRAGVVPDIWEYVPVEFSILGLDVAWGVQPQVFWALWSIVLGGFVWGAQRRTLWGGLGILGMLIGWYLVAILTPVYGSMAVFMFSNYALLAYVLQPKYALMEPNRWGASAAETTAPPKTLVVMPPVQAEIPEEPAPPAPPVAAVPEEEPAVEVIEPEDDFVEDQRFADIPPLELEDLQATERRILRSPAKPSTRTEPLDVEPPTIPDDSNVHDELDTETHTSLRATPPTEPLVDVGSEEDQLKTEPRKPPTPTPPTQPDIANALDVQAESSPDKPSTDTMRVEYPTEDASKFPKIKIDSSKVRTKPLPE